MIAWGESPSILACTSGATKSAPASAAADSARHWPGPKHPEFIGFGTEALHCGIQKAATDNDPPSVLTWQIGVTDIDGAMERCRSAGISYELERNNPAPGWAYRRLLIRTPSGYRLALEGPTE